MNTNDWLEKQSNKRQKETNDNEKQETEMLLNLLGTQYILERCENIVTDSYDFKVTDTITGNVQEFTIEKGSYLDLFSALTILKNKIRYSIQVLVQDNLDRLKEKE